MDTKETVQRSVEGLAVESFMVSLLKAELVEIDKDLADSPLGQHRARVKELLDASQTMAKEWRGALDNSAMVAYLTEADKKPHEAVSIRVNRQVVFTDSKWSDVYLARWAGKYAPHWLKLDRRVANKEIAARFKAAFDGLDDDAFEAKFLSMAQADQALWEMVTLQDAPAVTVRKDLSAFVAPEEKARIEGDSAAWRAAVERIKEREKFVGLAEKPE